jgi:hypothetical protein
MGLQPPMRMKSTSEARTNRVVILNGVYEVRNPGILRCPQNDIMGLVQSFPGYSSSLAISLTPFVMRNRQANLLRRT